MAFVLDASVAISWAFADEGHPLAAAALERLRSEPAHAPSLWRFELANALVVNERRGRISEPEAAQFIRLIGRLPIRIDSGAAMAELVRTARTYGLTAYDAAYLELAVRLGAPLATLDARLAQAASRAGVTVFAAGAG